MRLRPDRGWSLMRVCTGVGILLCLWSLALHAAFPRAYETPDDTALTKADDDLGDLVHQLEADGARPVSVEEIIEEGNSWEWIDPRVREILDTDDAFIVARSVSAPQQNLRAKATQASVPQRLHEAVLKLAPLLSLDVLVHESNFTADVVIAGDPKIIERDFVPIQLAYEERGLNVSLAPAIARRPLQPQVGLGTLASVRYRPWAVVLCATTRTERCMAPEDFLQLERRRARGRFTRVNWLAGLEQVLWSKDSFCESMTVAGAWLPTFGFACWVLPRDTQELVDVLAERGRLQHMQRRGAWIAKPYKRGGGIGIFVLDNDIELRRVMASQKRELVVQPYLFNPHLIEGRKWDVRAYALVTSVAPFARVFLFDDGLVRLAGQPYNAAARHGGKRTQFLTNTSVNKKQIKDMSQLTWPFMRLRETLGEDAYALLWERMKRATAMTFVAAEAKFTEFYARNMSSDFRCASCFQLIGVDLMVDQDLFPRVIEVNGEPNMQLTGEPDSHYDMLKMALQRETARIALQPAAGLAQSTSDRIARLALEEEELDAIADDADAVEYLLMLQRELEHAERFGIVYPDRGACGDNGGRARLWDSFLDTVLSNDSIRDAARRKVLHKVASRFVASEKCNEM